MKIGIYTPYLDSLTGGEKYMLEAALCIAQQHEVFIFWNPQDGEAIRKGAKERFNFNLASLHFEENIFSAHTPFRKRYKESKKYDKIFILSDGSMPLIGTPLYVHFQFPVEWVRNSLKTKLKIKRAKKIICNSFFTKEYIDKKFGIKSDVLYPPVESPSLKKVKKENVILHVGRFGLDKEGENFKKQDVLIDSFKKMIDTGLSKWKLVLVIGVRESDKQKLDKLKEMSEDYPIEIIENPQRERLLNWYNKAKIYWHASGYGEDLKKNPEKAEHFGISTVEAMSYGGVPVVINAGGQREIVSDGENGFLWNSIDELISLTKKLIDNKELLDKISEKARQSSERFSDKHFRTHLYELLNL